MSAGTAGTLGVDGHHRLSVVADGAMAKVGAFSVLPFGLVHDAAEPLGFFIGIGSERLLFIPDTGFIKNRFEGITILAVECNHIADILSQNIVSGGVPGVVGRRVRRNHMELSVLIAMLRANDLRACRAIYLLHLSDGNSDERRMVKEVQAATGIPTVACA